MIDNYIYFYNHQRIQAKTKLTPLELRRQYVAKNFISLHRGAFLYCLYILGLFKWLRGFLCFSALCAVFLYHCFMRFFRSFSAARARASFIASGSMNGNTHIESALTMPIGSERE